MFYTTYSFSTILYLLLETFNPWMNFFFLFCHRLMASFTFNNKLITVLYVITIIFDDNLLFTSSTSLHFYKGKITFIFTILSMQLEWSIGNLFWATIEVVVTFNYEIFKERMEDRRNRTLHEWSFTCWT